MIDVPNLQEVAAAPVARQLEELEERVRRLEDQLRLLQDTQALEARVAERVTERVRRTNATVAESKTTLVQAGRKFLPAALSAFRPSAVAPDAPADGPSASPRAGWLIFDLYTEIRLIASMLVDPSYRLSWTARLVPLLSLVLIFISAIFFDHFVIWIFDKIVDIVLVVISYKVLTREAHHYVQQRLTTPAPTASRRT